MFFHILAFQNILDFEIRLIVIVLYFTVNILFVAVQVEYEIFTTNI